MSINRCLAAATVFLCACGGVMAQPLGTTMTYQGELRSAGAPAAGLHDLRFRLFDAAAGGAQVGSTLCADNVSVVDGRFTVQLDFGGQFTGQQRFLEIEVRPDTGLNCSNSAGFTLLLPRQSLTATPNSVFALSAATANTANSAATAATATTATTANSATTAITATNATQLNGQGPSFYQNASNLTAGVVPSAQLSGTYSGVLSLTNAGNAINGTFSGGGAGLTGLNASNVSSGTLSAARLPIPLTLVGASASHIVRGENSSATPGATGVYGQATASSGENYGGRFESFSTSGRGAVGYAGAGSGQTYGVFAEAASTGGTGLYAYASAPTGTTYGVYAVSGSNAGRGVFGSALASEGDTAGGWFQSASTAGRGVYARASASSGQTFGVWGLSDSNMGIGVYGQGVQRGVWGYSTAGGSQLNYAGHFQATGTQGIGVYAENVGPLSGNGIGVFGTIANQNGVAVYGHASLVGPGQAHGGQFSTYSESGRGVFGWGLATSGVNYGVYGLSESTQGYAGYFTGKGPDSLRVVNSGSGRGMLVTALTDTAIWATTNSGLAAVDGRNSSTGGYGVFGWSPSATGNTYGVYGRADSPTGFALWAQGRTGASGTKSFRIDHPEDPENKYLLHYSTESPEVLNTYSGTIILDGAGQAVVELPHYFARINKDPRYLLTAVGAPMPMLHVAREIEGSALIAGAAAGPGVVTPVCTFMIAGGAAGAKVSWRIEAVRNDRWMQQRGAPVEVEKEGAEKGTYQHPEFYGQSAEKGVNCGDLQRSPEVIQDRAPPAPPAAPVR